MFISINLLGPIEKCITCTKIVRCLVFSHKLFSELCDTWWYEKISAIFFIERLGFFPKKLLSGTFYVLQKLSYNLHNVCRKTLWSLIKFCMMSAMLGNRRTNRPFFFLIAEMAIFLKSCSYRPLRSHENDLMTGTILF